MSAYRIPNLYQQKQAVYFATLITQVTHLRTSCCHHQTQSWSQEKYHYLIDTDQTEQRKLQTVK